MTSKDASDQERTTVRERAVWLARFPAAKAAGGTVHRARQSLAHDLAAGSGTQIVGEFLYAASNEEGLDTRVWGEVIDLLRHLKATTLVVLIADEVSKDSVTYLRHIARLETAGARVLLPDSGAASAASEAEEAARVA